jgi:hypothetical protein
VPLLSGTPGSLGNVLDMLFAEIGEDDRQLVAHLGRVPLPRRRSRRVRRAPQAGGDVDPVAKPSNITSATRTPMRKRIGSPATLPGSSLVIAFCTATAQATASTALAKSAITLSPAVLKMRPRWAAISPSMMTLHALSISYDINRL